MRPAESFIGQPIRSLQTMLRVLSEDNRRLPTVVPDGIYGPTTMQAVASFQRINALPSTGITDQTTWEAIVESYESALIRLDSAESIEIAMDPGQVFRAGDSSPYIYLLQGMLMFLSVHHSSIRPPSNSGLIDEETSVSISDFQSLAGLPDTGELDKVTWKQLVRQFTLNAHHVSKNAVSQSNTRDILDDLKTFY